MRHQKSEIKSLIISKKEMLLDQLLNSIEGDDSGTGDSLPTKPQWVLITNYNYFENPLEQPGPILEEDRLNLTRYFRRNEAPRIIKNLGGCREWAMESRENWMKIITDGKQLLWDYAKKYNDTQFWEAVKRFETRGRR